MAKDFHQIHWDAALESDCRQLVRLAVLEDLDRGFDWTTVALVDSDAQGSAAIVARRAGVVAGLPAARLAAEEIDPLLQMRPVIEEGSLVAAGGAIAALSGPARSLLTAERILLNLLGHLSGIATLTRQYVDAVAHTRARIYDTRKTTPAWRRLEKYAVRQGGGHNHRTGLFDAILVKDNHLAIGASIGAARLGPADCLDRVRAVLSEATREQPSLAEMIVEVEVESLAQLAIVLRSGPDIVLLDNMTLDDLRQAVVQRNTLAPDVELEASGGVNLTTVAAIAATGVERISVGALTHSAGVLDMGLDWIL